MRTIVKFRSFEGLDHIREFILEKVEHSIGRFETRKEFDTHVIMSEIKGRSESHRPIFECELLVRRPHQPSIFVKKSNSDFYQAVRSCVKSVEKTLRRASKMRVSKRRHVNEKSIMMINNVAYTE